MPSTRSIAVQPVTDEELPEPVNSTPTHTKCSVPVQLHASTWLLLFAHLIGCSVFLAPDDNSVVAILIGYLGYIIIAYVAVLSWGYLTMPTSVPLNWLWITLEISAVLLAGFATAWGTYKAGWTKWRFQPILNLAFTVFCVFFPCRVAFWLYYRDKEKEPLKSFLTSWAVFNTCYMLFLGNCILATIIFPQLNAVVAEVAFLLGFILWNMVARWAVMTCVSKLGYDGSEKAAGFAAEMFARFQFYTFYRSLFTSVTTWTAFALFQVIEVGSEVFLYGFRVTPTAYALTQHVKARLYNKKSANVYLPTIPPLSSTTLIPPTKQPGQNLDTMSEVLLEHQQHEKLLEEYQYRLVRQSACTGVAEFISLIIYVAYISVGRIYWSKRSFPLFSTLSSQEYNTIMLYCLIAALTELFTEIVLELIIKRYSQVRTQNFLDIKSLPRAALCGAAFLSVHSSTDALVTLWEPHALLQ